MRTFYIFKISNDLRILTKDSPYNLYRTLEGIYLLDKNSISYGKDLLDQVIVPLDKEKYNKDLYEKNKDNDFYMKFGNTHKIINKYRKEETQIIVKNSHIVLKTNVLIKNIDKFFPNPNYFACDFISRDYFWLTKLVTSEKVL